MYSTQLRDLTAPILDFQNLAKLLAKRWRDYAVDRKKKDCRKVLGLLQRAVSESGDHGEASTKEEETESPAQQVNGDDEGDFDWTKLGFETNDPTNEINGMGFLGLLDFASFVQRDSESFNKVAPPHSKADNRWSLNNSPNQPIYAVLSQKLPPQ
jgi:engulfment/cell motility protein 1